MSETFFLQWLVRAVLGGGIILLAAWWCMRRIESPARRQRLGEWALVAALCVAVLAFLPGWIEVRLPWPAASVPAPPPPLSVIQEPVAVDVEELPDLWHLVPLAAQEERVVEAALPSQDALERADVAPIVVPWESMARLATLAYALTAGAMLVWWLAGHVVLWSWLRRGVSPTPRLASLWREATGGRVRLLVSPRVKVPFSCGLIRPTVVLPARLMHEASTAELRWVLHHELRHLERWDTLSAVLFGLGQSVYFYLPWFWWLRHEVRLSQEYLADQAAVEAGGDRVDYADFLAGWATAPGLPVAVPAVIGQGSDLFRRIRMLLEERRSLESRCPRRWLWLTAGGLLAFAVVLSGVGPTTSAVRADDKKPDEKQADKPEKKKDDEKKEEKLDKPKNDKPADKPDKPKVKRSTGSDLFDKLLEQIPADLDPAQAKMIRDQLEAARKQMEQAMNLKDRVIWGQNRFPGGPVIVGRGNQEPRLGLMLAIPSSTLAEQLDLPKGQGLVVENVIKDSPAARAGMKPNDVLLELAGKAVTDRPDQLVKQVQALEPNKPVDAVVLRKGKKETVKGLTLPEVRKANVPAKPNVSESSLNLSRTGDSFNLTSREGAKSIVMRGKVVDGKAQLANVTITDGKVRGSYESLDKVPAEHQEAVKALLALCEAGKTKKP